MVMPLGAKRRIRVIALLISVAALSVAGIVALRIHAGRVAKKAERLQADVLRLTPGVTTLGEVRRFVNQTERPEGYAGFDGPCDESACVVSVGQDAFLRYWGSPILRPLAVFGVRPASYVAIVLVGDGIVRKVSFGVFYQAARQQTFSGAVVLVQRFSSGDLHSSSASRAHPAFAVCGDALRAEGGVQIGRYLTVGTATDSTTERIRLNLACVTSARGCSGPAELFQLENTSIPDLIQHTTPPQCPAETLAWSNNWPSGTYPK